MKVGDKVNCIKDCVVEQLNFFSIKKFYEIIHIIHLPNENIMYYIRGNNGTTFSFFVEDEKEYFVDYKYNYHFGEYFIDLRKLRKLKLDKIAR